jgi:hypothetical protein
MKSCINKYFYSKNENVFRNCQETFITLRVGLMTKGRETEKCFHGSRGAWNQ